MPPGEVAQLVEHTTENRGVAGSNPALATNAAPRTAARRASPAAGGAASALNLDLRRDQREAEAGATEAFGVGEQIALVAGQTK